MYHCVCAFKLTVHHWLKKCIAYGKAFYPSDSLLCGDTFVSDISSKRPNSCLIRPANSRIMGKLTASLCLCLFISSLNRRGKGRNSVILVGAPSFVSLQLAMSALGTQTAKQQITTIPRCFSLQSSQR